MTIGSRSRMSVDMINDALSPKDLSTHCPLCGRGFDVCPATDEHIFPRWLQDGYGIRGRRLNIPNAVDRHYKSVKVGICRTCNNETYSRLEARLAPMLTSDDPYEAAAAASDRELAVWLGKIFWLLLRKHNADPDFRTRRDPVPDMVIPGSLMPGAAYLGLFQRAFATGRDMMACYIDDPADTEFYEPPFSLYRVKIDVRDTAAEAFDFVDDPFVLGAAIRLGTLGLICLFDGGLHRDFRAMHFPYLESESHHPVQFAETAGLIFYDGTVMHEQARGFQTFWSPALASVVAVNETPRSFDPYMMANHDPRRLARYLGRVLSQDPAEILDSEGNFFSTILEPGGGFFRYPVTEDEIAAHRRDPHRRFILQEARWRMGASNSAR
ncbi:HNH endonuclease [Methylobacterium sp. WL69]|uniref:HNH endonuclease n=1 Tax=Methylobacterium sp. WL69 TaxID=2603893 RepID=UPI0011CC39FF|nr:HNH endonuclease [Methylobacterium sp. WL69]TXM74206.1 HNH endonuclease [Methylobacterium sp. WL69]